MRKKGSLNITTTFPNALELREHIKTFSQKEGIITAFSETKLRAAKSFIQDDTPIEFIVFSDLLGRANRFIGETVARPATQGQLKAAVSFTSQELPNTSPFYASSKFPGFHEHLIQVLIELHTYGYRANDLLDIARKVNQRTAEKLESIALLENNIIDLFQRQGLEFTTDRIHRCLEKIEKDSLSDLRILVLGSPNEYPIYEDWLKWAASCGANIELILEYIPSRTDLFRETYGTIDRLGVNPKKSKNTTPWYTVLFSDQKAISSTPELSITSSADPLAECEWTLRDCLQSINEGTWPHKIGIFIRDSQAYAPLLIATAKRLGVPLNITLHNPLLTNGFAIFTLDLLEALASHDIRLLAKLSKSSYLQLNHEFQNIFIENIQQAYTQKSLSWNTLHQWALHNKEDYPWLPHLLEWQQQVTQNDTTLTAWLERFRNLIGGTSLLESIANDPTSTRERDLRAQTAMQRALADYALTHDMKSHRVLNLKSFTALCRSIWEQEDMIMPTTGSGVIVTSSVEEFPEIESLYALGMLEGIIPKRRTEDPILNDEDRWEIARVTTNKVPLKDSFSVARSERDLFVRLCATAHRKIVFSYPQTDETRDNVPAFYLHELERKLAKKIKKHNQQRTRLAPALESCISPSDSSIRQALDGPRKQFFHELTTEEAKTTIKRNLEIAITPAELSSATVCPFKAIFQYHLNVEQPYKTNLWHYLKRIPLLSNLPNLSNTAEAETILQSQVILELERLLPKLSSWEIILLHSGAQRLVKGWVAREFLAREIWPSTNNTYKSQVDLGESELRNEIPVNGIKIQLKGKIDGLSVRDNYSVMHFFTSHLPNLDADLSNNPEMFIYGLYLMTQFGRQPGLALEIDSMSGERILALLPRFLNAPLQSKSQDGLIVKEIAEDPGIFFKNVKEHLSKSVTILKEGSITVNPGDHCLNCGYGEICRSSSDFGEATSLFEGNILPTEPNVA